MKNFFNHFNNSKEKIESFVKTCKKIIKLKGDCLSSIDVKCENCPGHFYYNKEIGCMDNGFGGVKLSENKNNFAFQKYTSAKCFLQFYKKYYLCNENIFKTPKRIFKVISI